MSNVVALQHFVLQSKLTEFSAILKQQQNDNKSRLISKQKRDLERGHLQTAFNNKIIAQSLYGKARAISCSVIKNPIFH